MATRSREVCTDADRMLTCWSDSTRVTSESSRLRSSASTWSCDEEDAAPTMGAHSTSISRSGWREQRLGVGAVGAVHRDAVAAGDEADDRVAGHRRAAPGQLDPHVGGADDDDARVARRAGAGARVGMVASARSSVAPSSPPSEATSRPTTCWADTWPSPTAAYRAVDVLVAQLGRRGRSASRGVMQPLERQALLAHRLGDGVLAGLDGLLAALLGEPLLDLVAGPRALDELAASRATARRRRPWR